MRRIERLVRKDLSSQAAIIRKCVVRYLPELEREILGDEFVDESGARTEEAAV